MAFPDNIRDREFHRFVETNNTDTAVRVLSLQALVPAEYDEIVLSYTGANLTGVVYKQATVTVATLTLGYTGANLTSVVRT